MSSTNDRLFSGLGTPGTLDRYELDSIDPTLDACCRREAEQNRRYNALQASLRRHDVVAERERRRRHLVSSPDWTGCRCCFDPNEDGGEYRALMELRARRQAEESRQAGEPQDSDSFSTAAMEKTETSRKITENNDSSEADADDPDDDEFDYLLDEDLPGQADLEQQRLAELELAALNHETALQHGYGRVRQMHPSRVLKATGLVTKRDDLVSAAPSAVVLHLVDPESVGSASLDLYLEQLAPQCRGTLFLRCGGRACLLMDAGTAQMVLPHLHPDGDMPCLVAIRHGTTVQCCPNLCGLLDDDGMIMPNQVYQWLDHCQVLQASAPAQVCRIRPEEEALMDYLARQVPKTEEARYDCGVPGCHKTFPHEHVGVTNEQQRGVLVSEAAVLGVEPNDDKKQ